MLVKAIRDHVLRGRPIAAGDVVDVTSGEFDRSGGLYRQTALTPDEIAMLESRHDPAGVMVAPPGAAAGAAGATGDAPPMAAPADSDTEKRRRGRPPSYGRRDLQAER